MGTSYPRMLSGLPCHSRFSAGYAPFILTIGWFAISIATLTAQTASAPDLWTPAADATPSPAPTPVVPATPALPTPPQTSAATVVSDSSQPVNANNLSSGAGPTPTAGPGAAPQSDLASQIASASFDRKLPLRLTATLGEVYDNNIFSRAKKEGDFITRVAVRGDYQIGDLTATDGNYFNLVYAPSLHVYARHSHETGVDQYAGALYGHRWTKLTLTLEQSYHRTQETDASVGGLVTADEYITVLKANYKYSPSIDLVAVGRQDFTNYDEPDYTDSKEWVGSLYALYHIDSKISVGFGPNFGYLNPETAPNETYQQFLARVIYDPTSRIHIEGTAGAEDRQYQTNQRSDTLEPVFAISGSYVPNPSTTLGMNAARQFRPSYNAIGQDYIATNVFLSARQRFFEAYFLGVEAGYENDDYQNVAVAAGPTREDDYFFVQPSLSWDANGWLKIAAFDRYEEDSSNFDLFSYDTNQVGVSISATY